MQSQLKKLAVICNICFWLTIIFQYWRYARIIPPDILNTIVILGVVAIVANTVWVCMAVFNTSVKNKNPEFLKEDGSESSQLSKVVFKWFNQLSLIFQLVWFLIKFI